jgi:hypothetical protein
MMAKQEPKEILLRVVEQYELLATMARQRRLLDKTEAE